MEPDRHVGSLTAVGSGFSPESNPAVGSGFSRTGTSPTHSTCPDTQPVRPLTLRRRRSRVPWIYLLYHRTERRPDAEEFAAVTLPASEETPARQKSS